jgi:hypothetical protein
MEPQLGLALLGIVSLSLALALGYYCFKWRSRQVTSELVAVAKPQTASEVQSKLDQISSRVEYLAQYLKIGEGIYDYGSRIKDAYDDFIMRIEDEFSVLEQRQIEGREYVFRSSMLLFSLMMARVYLEAVGPRDSIPELERYIERAERIA